MKACWPWPGPSSGCRRRGLAAAREVGRSVSRCSGAPQLGPPFGGGPCWEAFPEVNRALVVCLLGLLAGRMMTPAAAGAGGERDERAG